MSDPGSAVVQFEQVDVVFGPERTRERALAFLDAGRVEPLPPGP